jgi:hypothetical protein
VDQNIEKNKADILQLANHHDLGRVRFVEEKISGKVEVRSPKRYCPDIGQSRQRFPLPMVDPPFEEDHCENWHKS